MELDSPDGQVWLPLDELLNRAGDQKNVVISQIESGQLRVFMWADSADLEVRDDPSPPITFQEMSGMMEVYAHCAVSVLRGGGPHGFNFLRTDEPYDEHFGSGLVYDGKPALSSRSQLYVRLIDAEALQMATKPRVKVKVSNGWKVVDFGEAGGVFRLNDAQAAIVRFMAGRRTTVTSDELRNELSRCKIEPKTRDRKFDFANIFKQGSPARKLVQFSQTRGVYCLSDLWGENQEIEEIPPTVASGRFK